MSKRLDWRVHTPNLLNEVLNNPGSAIFTRPFQIFAGLLAQVAARAIELNDRDLNVLMCRLTLYSVADPSSSDYDKETLDAFLRGEAKLRITKPEENAPLHDVWGEHPDHPVADWQYEVADGDTRSGYWDWVESRL